MEAQASEGGTNLQIGVHFDELDDESLRSGKLNALVEVIQAVFNKGLDQSSLDIAGLKIPENCIIWDPVGGHTHSGDSSNSSQTDRVSPGVQTFLNNEDQCTIYTNGVRFSVVQVYERRSIADESFPISSQKVWTKYMTHYSRPMYMFKLYRSKTYHKTNNKCGIRSPGLHSVIGYEAHRDEVIEYPAVTQDGTSVHVYLDRKIVGVVIAS